MNWSTEIKNSLKNVVDNDKTKTENQLFCVDSQIWAHEVIKWPKTKGMMR